MSSENKIQEGDAVAFSRGTEVTTVLQSSLIAQEAENPEAAAN